MEWSTYQILIACVLVFTGSINTLSLKWVNRFDVRDADGKIRKFNHPFLQASCMFVGEILCLAAYKCIEMYYNRKGAEFAESSMLLKGNRKFNRFVLLPPAACDMIATCIMYIGLTLTHASSFQMFRGAVIVFVGLFSIIFLKRKLKVREWIGICVVIVGLVIVGLSDQFAPDETEEHIKSNSTRNKSKSNKLEEKTAKQNKMRAILGDGLIVGAQIIVATQMVLEEKYVSKLDIPALQAVGYEGVFGFILLGLFLIPANFIKVPEPFSHNSRDTLEDLGGAFTQMGNNFWIIVSFIGAIISIAFFNFAGITITKELSATTRMILDSARTLVIYLTTLALRWQAFFWLQVPGFIILLIGMALYNNLFGRHIFCWKANENSDSEERRQATVNSALKESSSSINKSQEGRSSS